MCFQKPRLFLANFALFQKTLHPADALEFAPGSAQQAATLLASAVPGRALEDAPVRAQRVAPMTALGHAPDLAQALALDPVRARARRHAQTTVPALAKVVALVDALAAAKPPVFRHAQTTAAEAVQERVQERALEAAQEDAQEDATQLAHSPAQIAVRPAVRGLALAGAKGLVMGVPQPAPADVAQLAKTTVILSACHPARQTAEATVVERASFPVS